MDKGQMTLVIEFDYTGFNRRQKILYFGKTMEEAHRALNVICNTSIIHETIEYHVTVNNKIITTGIQPYNIESKHELNQGDKSGR